MSKFDKIDDFIPIKRFNGDQKCDNIDSIQNERPLFSFDYMSMNKSVFCFNSTSLGRKDYIDLLNGLKRISKYTYKELEKENMFHFHSIDWNDVTISQSDFNKCIGNKNIQLTAYQFKVFNKARIIGFIFQSIFYLVMFDRNHKAYHRDRHQKNK